jgi:diphthine synthase
MLYLIGLGLNDENDIPLKAIEPMKKCAELFIEFYTNKWFGNIERLENMTGKKIKMLERLEVESDYVIQESKKKDVALLIPGDPLSATTHFELIIEAKKHNVDVSVIHASSVYTAVAETGLQLYKFGRATTLVFPEQRFAPESHYDVIENNLKMGLHTLVLLDVRHEAEKYMTANEGLNILLDIESRKSKGIIKGTNKVFACCRLGSNAQIIKYGKISNLLNDKDIQVTPAVIVIPGQMNFKEEEAAELFEK